MTTGTTPSFPERYSYTGTQFSGGQAEVFVCSDSLLERKVAIKVIKNISDLPAFYQEIAAIQDISSRHIAEIYDLISNAKDGHPGLVEEYVPGYPLTEFPDANVTLDGYLKALYQIACGIADMHAHNKIHRDIKPANMKFDDENIIKILDFGITCDIDPSVETIAARGTLGFRAPELYSPPITVTPAVDVYAFGATAWYLATKTLPPALLEIPPISKQTAPSFSDLPLKLAQDIVAVLDNTLSVEPSARPLMGTVRDVIKDRLLFGAHKAEFTYGEKKWPLEKPDTQIKLGKTNLGNITVGYDGIRFIVNGFEGDVYINNKNAEIGSVLPNSCVVTIGAPALKGQRSFIPFNVSHPEVVL